MRRRKKKNGEDLPTVLEKLKRLSSNHPLKCIETSFHYKTYLTWRIVYEKEANGEELPTMEELKELQSNHLLKYLATILSYKTYLAWQVVHEKEANDEDLLKME